MNGVLELIFKSTKDFHNCFDNFPPDLDGQVFAFKEEVKEFLEAINNDAPESIIEEALDVIVTITSIFMAKGIDYSKIVSWANLVASKNMSKNDTTHIKDEKTGKIRRKSIEEIISEGALYAIVPITDYDWSELREKNRNRSNKLEFATTEDNKHTLALVVDQRTKSSNKYITCLKFYKGGIITGRKLVNTKDISIDQEMTEKLRKKWGID